MLYEWYMDAVPDIRVAHWAVPTFSQPCTFMCLSTTRTLKWMALMRICFSFRKAIFLRFFIAHSLAPVILKFLSLLRSVKSIPVYKVTLPRTTAYLEYG